MRRVIGWSAAVVTSLVVVFFTFPWFCAGEIASTIDGSEDSWHACGTIGILLEKDIPMGLQIPVSILAALGVGYFARRLVVNVGFGPKSEAGRGT